MPKSAVSELASNCASAGIAGFIQPLIFNPLDCLRIRWQVASTDARCSTLGQFAAGILRREGLMRGFILPGQPWNCIAVSLSQGLRLGLYPSVRDALASSSGGGGGGMRPDLMALAGFLSGSLAYFVIAPLWLLKTRAQAAPQLGDALQPLPSSLIPGYWVGCTPLVLRGALITAGWTSGYESTKRLLRERTGEGPLLHCCAGTCAGIGAATLSAPADVLQTRMQSHKGGGGGGGAGGGAGGGGGGGGGRGGKGGKGANTPHTPPSPAVLSSARAIWAADGVSGFFRGWSVSVMRLVPTVIFGSLIYEQSRRLLGLGYTR